MPLVRNGAVAGDPFVPVPDDQPVPDDAPALVTAARLVAEGEAWAARRGALGVSWPNDRSVAELAPHLDRLALVALSFPNFRDGRAYSQARILRERYRFRGELRATGQVLRDQFLLMHRAGFDAFAVSKEADAAAFVEALTRYSVFYQPAGDTAALRSRLKRSSVARSCAEAPG